MTDMINSTSTCGTRWIADGQGSMSGVEGRLERLQQIISHIDFALEAEIRRLNGEQDRERLPVLIESLRKAHRQCRDPYLRQFADLQGHAVGQLEAR